MTILNNYRIKLFCALLFCVFFCNSHDSCYTSKDNNYYLCASKYWWHVCGVTDYGYGLLWIPIKSPNCSHDCENIQGVAIYESDKNSLSKLKDPTADCIFKNKK